MTINSYNAAMLKVLPKMPNRIRALPTTEEGWPQLWFAGITKEGKPDLRTADPAKRVRAVKQSLCWLCGQTIGAFKCFVIGPMCAVTRSTAEPACHRECAEFAAIACPFLTKPKMQRNTVDLPEGHVPPPGTPIMRNPAVTCIWITRDFGVFGIKKGKDWLIRVGDPVEVLWYAEGKLASREQILQSIDSGLPILLREAEKDGPEGIAELNKYRLDVEKLLPETPICSHCNENYIDKSLLLGDGKVHACRQCWTINQTKNSMVEGVDFSP